VEYQVRTNVIEIVVLSTGADALLAVDGALELGLLRSGVNLTEEDGLELVHTSICKEQSGAVGKNELSEHMKNVQRQ
jgi:hypothetical protein